MDSGPAQTEPDTRWTYDGSSLVQSFKAEAEDLSKRLAKVSVLCIDRQQKHQCHLQLVHTASDMTGPKWRPPWQAL